jgi:hypothetical protein
VNSLALASTCNFSCNGADGVSGTALGGAAGGGGGGGRSRLLYGALKDENSATFTATPGAAGVGFDPGVTSGHGGIGVAGVFELRKW